MQDKDGKKLLDLVIGKKVADSKGKELRYVRKVGQDPIYVVALKTDKLSTKFDDWIERNLLKMESWDIAPPVVRRLLDRRTSGVVIQRGKIEIAYNDTGEPHWKLLKDYKYVSDPKSPDGGKFAADRNWPPTRS